MKDAGAAKDVDQYIATASDEARPKLLELRQIIRECAPAAEERISYGMPGYYYHGPLVYFGGFKKHVSLFAAGSQTVAKQFKDELKPYTQSKGTIQFPFDTPLPSSLIRDIVKLRVKENEVKPKS